MYTQGRPVQRQFSTKQGLQQSQCAYLQLSRQLGMVTSFAQVPSVNDTKDWPQGVTLIGWDCKDLQYTAQVHNSYRADV